MAALTLPLLRQTMADTSELVWKVASAHGARHPELREVETVWTGLRRRMSHYLRVPSAAELEAIVALAERIRELTASYSLPPDACDAYQELLRDLETVEHQLHERS